MYSKMFHTANGQEEFLLKSYDGSQVPIGHYYESDIFGRWQQINKVIHESVAPVMTRLLDIEIPKYFYLDVLSMDTKVFAGPYKHAIKKSSMAESLQEVCLKFEGWDSWNLDFFINLEFNSNVKDLKVSHYGCQISVSFGSETIQEVETENDYGVWYLYLGQEKTLIDSPFTKEQEDKIIGHYLGCLWQSEEMEISQNY
ncbi:MAG: hypothetical protein U0V54_06025 [Saprospiraceae bacterium]